MKKVLHITPWFPDEENPYNAVWIKRQIEALEHCFENKVLHLVVRRGSFAFRKQMHSENNIDRIHLQIPWVPWRVIEWIYALLIWNYTRKQQFDLLNFHIAYPSLVFYKGDPKTTVVTEHWSYYHYHFHTNRELKRVKRIFTRPYSFICVSEALRNDIQKFSGIDFHAHIVPNVINERVFNIQKFNRGKTLVTGAFWKSPKKPFKIIEAFRTSNLKQSGWTLKIFGYGPLSSEIQESIETENAIHWMGILTPLAVAKVLNEASGFLMWSGYETFSVATAEALCCGCPVLVNDVGALPELINQTNGICIKEGDSLEDALVGFTSKTWDHASISKEALAKYSKEHVGGQYAEILNKL